MDKQSQFYLNSIKQTIGYECINEVSNIKDFFSYMTSQNAQETIKRGKVYVCEGKTGWVGIYQVMIDLEKGIYDGIEMQFSKEPTEEEVEMARWINIIETFLNRGYSPHKLINDKKVHWTELEGDLTQKWNKLFDIAT